jgi:hypothetical protein
MRWTIAIMLVGLGADAAAQNMTGKKEESMANCPSAVAGAVTRVVDTPDGVELYVTARRPDAQREIQQRATRQAEIAIDAARGSMEHTGLGTGSGRYGYCPGMLQQTTVAAFDLPDGARLVVKPFRVEDVPALQKITHERARALERHELPAPRRRAHES